jgi:hypothetical protein
MQRWDLTTGIVYKPSSCRTKLEKKIHNKPSIKSNKMHDWAEPLGLSIGELEGAFDPYVSMLEDGEVFPLLMIENQFDGAASDYKKTIMERIFDMTVTGFAAADTNRRTTDLTSIPKRMVERGMSKYGQRCDGSRIRVDRKDKGVDDLKELLEDQGTPEADVWLKWLYYMESIKEQIHDMCDAILLAVQKCITLYEKKVKADIQQKRSVLRKIPRAPIQSKKSMKRTEPPEFTDDNLPTEDDCAGFKKRDSSKKSSSIEGIDEEGKEKEPVTKKPRKTRSDKGKKKVAVEKEKDSKKKDKNKKNKKDKKDKTKVMEVVEDDDDEILHNKKKRKRSDDDDDVNNNTSPTTKKHKKKKDKDKEYPILLDIRDMEEDDVY